MAGRNSRGAGAPSPGSPADQTPEADPHEVARSIVLRQLTLGPRSRKQLADKLSERNVPADVAVAVLDRFEEVQLVNDAYFARMWVRSRFQSRSLARGALKRELADKGITAELADEALEQVSPEDEAASARDLVRRKMRPDWDLADRQTRDKHVRRLASMLARKGYPPSLAFRIVSEELNAGDGDWERTV